MSFVNWDKMREKNNIWIEEFYKDFMATKFRCKNILFSKQSPYQYIEVIEVAGMGRMLIHDGIVMLSERDEFVYHEMLAHVPFYTHPKAKKVLIIGGGDGGTAREVLKHENVTECHLVEIDKMVVDVAKRFFPNLATCFQDPRLKLHFQDGMQFVKETKERFDIVLVDSTDPLGPAKVLYSSEFYAQVKSVLSPDGVMVLQSQNAFLDLEVQKMILQTLKKSFPITCLYNYGNVSYSIGLWSFALASLKHHPVKDFSKARVAKKEMPLSYYTPDIHKASFAQAQFVKNYLAGLLDNE